MRLSHHSQISMHLATCSQVKLLILGHTFYSKRNETRNSDWSQAKFPGWNSVLVLKASGMRLPSQKPPPGTWILAALRMPSHACSIEFIEHLASFLLKMSLVQVVHASHFSHVQVFAIPWTVAYQAPLSMGFSRQNTGMGCHTLLQGILPTQGLNPRLLHWQAGSLPLTLPGKPFVWLDCHLIVSLYERYIILKNQTWDILHFTLQLSIPVCQLALGKILGTDLYKQEQPLVCLIPKIFLNTAVLSPIDGSSNSSLSHLTILSYKKKKRQCDI